MDRFPKSNAWYHLIKLSDKIKRDTNYVPSTLEASVLDSVRKCGIEINEVSQLPKIISIIDPNGIAALIARSQSSFRSSDRGYGSLTYLYDEFATLSLSKRRDYKTYRDFKNRVEKIMLKSRT